MARKHTPAPSFAPLTIEIANAVKAAASTRGIDLLMARNTDKKIDAVLDRVWLGVNTRSVEDEEKKWLDSWMSWMPERNGNV